MLFTVIHLYAPQTKYHTRSRKSSHPPLPTRHRLPHTTTTTPPMVLPTTSIIPPHFIMPPPKRPRVSSLPYLPDTVWLRIISFLCGYRTPYSPPRRGVLFHARHAFPLACSSTRLFRLFTSRFNTIDATPDGDFLNPLARTDSRFRVRDPALLRLVVRLVSRMLSALHLPLYDCSMDDAHWSVLQAVVNHAPNLHTLSFVDSFHHQYRTPLPVQTKILATLLPSITNLQVFLVRDIPKIDTMLTTPAFIPRSLTLHHIHPNVQPRLLDLLAAKGSTLHSLCLSFEASPHHISPPFLHSLAAVLHHNTPNLTHLELLRAPVRNPLHALKGPAITRDQSINIFHHVSTAINAIKAMPAPRPPLQKIVIESLCPDPSAALRLFTHSCDHRTEIDVYLHEVLLVSPAKLEDAAMPPPYFRATALHSSSWMISELPASYFRRTEHIKISADQDCRGSLIERVFPQDGSQINPDMRSFRFLCQQSGTNVRSVYASVPVESAEKANAVLRILSEGLAYARNVTCLEISGDLLRYVGRHHSQLYAVVGQLKKLVDLYVCEPGYGYDRGAQIENLPLLLRALWMNCRHLESFKFEFSSFGSASPPAALEQALVSLREFDRRLPGVETHNLGELLELSLRPQECRVGIG